MVSLIDLGPDILALHVLPLLSVDDLWNVMLVSRRWHEVVQSPLVWHELYANEFPADAYNVCAGIPASQWHALFDSRRKANVLAWGYVHDGRLGGSIADMRLRGAIPQGAHADRPGSLCLPTALPQFDGVVVKRLVAGVTGIAALTEDGHIFVTGEVVRRGSRNLPRNPFLLRGAPMAFPTDPNGQSTPPNTASGSASPPEGTTVRLEWQENILHTPEPTIFVQAAFGLSGVLGLDAIGHVWLWNQSKGTPGLRLRFDFENTGAKITQVCAYWNVMAAVTDTAGLCLWWPQTIEPNGNVRYATVSWTFAPSTSDWRVSQAAVGAGFVVFITATSQLFAVAAGDVEECQQCDPVPLQEATAAAIGESGDKFVDVSAGYNRFAAVTDSGTIVVAVHSRNTAFEPPQVFRLPNADRCVSISLGDHHTVALGSSGAVYTWGTESQGCGSFGLGTRAALAEAGATWRPVRNSMSLDHYLTTPTRVQIDGAVQISASGWQTTALTTRPLSLSQRYSERSVDSEPAAYSSSTSVSG